MEVELVTNDDEEGTAPKLQELQLVDTYQERYIKGNLIKDGEFLS